MEWEGQRKRKKIGLGNVSYYFPSVWTFWLSSGLSSVSLPPFIFPGLILLYYSYSRVEVLIPFPAHRNNCIFILLRLDFLRYVRLERLRNPSRVLGWISCHVLRVSLDLSVLSSFCLSFFSFSFLFPPLFLLFSFLPSSLLLPRLLPSIPSDQLQQLPFLFSFLVLLTLFSWAF